MIVQLSSQQGIRLMAQHLPHPGAYIGIHGINVNLPDEIACGLDKAAEPLLALVKLLLYPVTLGQMPPWPLLRQR